MSRPVPAGSVSGKLERDSPGKRWECPIRRISGHPWALCTSIDTADGCRAVHGVADPGAPISTTLGIRCQCSTVTLPTVRKLRSRRTACRSPTPRSRSSWSQPNGSSAWVWPGFSARTSASTSSGSLRAQPELVDRCAASSVDVVLIDLDLTKADSIGLVRLLASECPATKSLILTSQADWRVRPAMIAGSAGILLKDTSPESIRAAVISVHLGDQVLCNEAARWVLGEEYATHLTQRESDVLRMVAQGANNAEIAAELHLGQKTVRNYVSRIYGKLDLTNRAQIATYVARTEAARGPDLAQLGSRPTTSLGSAAHERTATQSADINAGDLATARPGPDRRSAVRIGGGRLRVPHARQVHCRRPGAPPAVRELGLRRVQHRHGGGDRQEHAGPGRRRSQALATAGSTRSQETGVRRRAERTDPAD